ncbi:MAG: dihydrodipicolinate synthase family protein, partial [Oscillospiraceae bacterium]|nr:dihydrodipicolinate synthase family protein [Oscillospiraceae bacterium]
YQRLSRVPNIVGVKEASSDITKILRIRKACGPDFTIWSGNDDQIVPAMACGASGVISVLSNVYPEETQAMCAAALGGDYEAAGALQRELLPLIDLLFCEVNPIPVKTAMKCIGYDCGDCRLPLCQPTKEHQKQIESYFA